MRGCNRALEDPKIDLFADGNLIQVVTSIRILGLRIQADGQNTETVKFLEKSVHETSRLISRIARRHHRMKKGNLIRLVHAFVLSRIACVTTFLRLRADEKIKLNTIIRKSYKQALGMPATTSNERFEALEIHNTLEELIEVQRVAQLERLTKTSTGRHILTTLRIRYESQFGTKREIPCEVWECIHVPPIPRNMHPERNKERRRERAKALQKRFKNSENVVYVYAAEYAARDAMTVVAIDCNGNSVTSGTILTSSLDAAEEAAIAMVMAPTKAKFIVSDSKTAIRNFAKGRISSEALRILVGFKDRRKVQIVCTPAHSSLTGNENAHDEAQGLASRADHVEETSEHFSRARMRRDRMVSYRHIINNYRVERFQYPPPHCTLNKWQSVAWSLLQTNTFPNPVSYSYCYLGLYTSECMLCTGRADVRHIVWECPQIKNSLGALIIIETEEQWETVLRSCDPDVEIRVVQMAEDAAGAQGLLAAV